MYDKFWVWTEVLFTVTTCIVFLSNVNFFMLIFFLRNCERPYGKIYRQKTFFWIWIFWCQVKLSLLPTWNFWCVLKDERNLKAFWHLTFVWFHSLCVFRCGIKFEALLKALPHWLHSKCWSRIKILWSVANGERCLKAFAYLWAFSTLWILWYPVSCEMWLKARPQSSHS